MISKKDICSPREIAEAIIYYTADIENSQDLPEVFQMLPPSIQFDVQNRLQDFREMQYNWIPALIGGFDMSKADWLRGKLREMDECISTWKLPLTGDPPREL